MERMKFDLEELHSRQVELFKKLTEICGKHGFMYFLGFGSLLGAVRENKILDWDDSIDVVMPYCDYEKLVNLSQNEWGKDLFLQTYDTDPQYPKCYAKLRDSNTTLIKADYVAYDINQGIYINIMPLINLADDEVDRKRQMKDAFFYKALTERDYSAFDSTLHFRSFSLRVLSEAKKIALREELKEKVLKYERDKTEECFVLAGYTSISLPLKKEWFASKTERMFQGMMVNIPAGWQEWLTLRYGNYMTVPISELQGDKIAGFVTLNTHRPYTDYKGKTYCC